MKNYGAQSMVSPLRCVLVSSPVAAGSSSWQTFDYMHPSDDHLAQKEHSQFVSCLQDFGTEVIHEPLTNPELQDGIFTYDPSIVTKHGAILANMGKDLRKAEVDWHKSIYQKLDIPILGRITSSGKFEGGDSLWLDENTLVVGRGYRTNQEGIEQLKGILEPLGITVISVDLPYYHGPNECLHLMSLINMLDHNLAAVLLPFMPVKLVELLEERDVELINMPMDEFDSQGNNILTLKPRVCLMVAGNTESMKRVKKAGCKVIPFQGEEISKNRCGGPTCLTRPLLRS